MDRVTRCLHCGKRLVPAPSFSGRTELKCVFCNDPMKLANRERPVAVPISEIIPKVAEGPG